MATTPASGGELSISVEPTAHADAAGGEVQQSESRSADAVRRKLKTLNKIVFCVAFLEWAGNAAGTLASIWATVVLLGGFCSLLIRVDFWFATVIVFMEGSSWCVPRTTTTHACIDHEKGFGISRFLTKIHGYAACLSGFSSATMHRSTSG